MSEHLRRSCMSSSPELRLVLLGNIGCGKTSSADTILGQLSHILPNASRTCQVRKGTSEGRTVTLVEAPRWYWNGGKMEESVRKETARAMSLLASGPHAFLLLVPVHQFTEMESHVPAELKELFGAEVMEHTLVLLTCGDYLMGKTEPEYLQKEHPGLRQIIEDCGGRYHVINNRKRHDREQVCELLEKVDQIVTKNGVYYMKTDQESEMEKRVQDGKQELHRAQREERRETVASTQSPNTETRRSVDREEEHSIALESRRREERAEVDRSVTVSQRPNALHSTPAPEHQPYSEPQDDRQTRRTPSFRLNADGAILSQVSEVKSTPKVVTTFHQRINSFEERSPEESPTFSPPASLRLVLLGRSGAGKSAAGNKILGRQEFESRPESLTAITQHCEKKKALVEGRQVALVDTPDWFNSEQSPDEVRAQISSCVALCSPGPHAFLLCVPIDQPAKTELKAIEALENIFGPDAIQRHTVLLFTYADKLKESGKAGKGSVETYIAGQREDLLKLVEKCGDRFHVMETGGGGRDSRNVAELLEKVEQTVRESGGQCYSHPAFQEAENKVRQRQVELAQERRRGKLEPEGQLNSEGRVLYSYMQPVAEADEEVREDDIEKTRDEAELNVSSMNIESLPPITLSTISPSLLHSIMETMGSNAKLLPKLFADSSVWVGEGAKKVKASPAWGTVGTRALNVQKMVADSSMWQKVGAGAGHGSAWVGSGAKAAAASPMWEKVGSGAKTGAKLMAESSALVGSRFGVGAKKVAQSPVWGKVGSGAKAGVKMVAESSVWEKIGKTAKQVPVIVIVGALLGLVLGVFLGRVIGGAVGAAAGAGVSEAVRRKFGNKSTLEKTDEAAQNAKRTMNNSVDPLVKQGKKVLKTE
ncbi:hypothetical protein CgunFtcFv8_022097 [Champsocephalus gunnari]|uniref:AIG1-type G domain-containing protein n=1 Tax=Champsocephalus gunnari TaxID=52237 RepID=A0AAN8DQN5_CHAGU|nr:hypothetical protein CgunFtcFv8_022097 [Champsocephalus gunnari]